MKTTLLEKYQNYYKSKSPKSTYVRLHSKVVGFCKKRNYGKGYVRNYRDRGILTRDLKIPLVLVLKTRLGTLYK